MEEKKMTEKEMEEKMNELKIELLKQKGKRKGIKKEIARLLTFQNKNGRPKGLALGMLEKKK
jgi:ribosomal protein L29